MHRYSFSRMGTAIGGKWTNDPNAAQLLVYENSIEHPSSSFRDKAFSPMATTVGGE